MKKLFLTLIAAISCLALNAETWTVGGVNYTVTRGTESYLGSSYHTLQQNITLNGSDGDQLKVFYSYTDLTNYDVAVEAVGAGSKLSNLNTVATMSGKTTSGTAVVGINADFFTSKCPSGMFANEGTVHKAFTGDGFSAICIDPNKVPYIGKLTKHTCWLNNQTTSTEFGWSDYAAINTTSENATKCGVGEQIIFYTPQYGSESGNAEVGGYAVQLKPVNGAKLTPGKYLTYEVVSSPSSGSVTIPSDGIVLYGKGSSNGAGVKSLKVGDKITVYLRMQLTENDGTIVDVATSDNGATKYVHNALGGSQMILCNGNVITSYANNAGAPGNDDPRTAVGYNANKSRLYLCIVDGRNSGWTNGCTVKMMGDIMKNLGCSDALNFDGGGSSQFWTNTKGLINDANTNNLGNGIRAVKNSLFITNIPGATLSTSASSLSFATEDNATVAKSVTATVTNWRTNVSLSLSGANADQFSLSSSAITKSATGSGAVTVTYKPTTAGTHTATLTLTTNEYTNKTITKTITLTGTNTETVVTPPVEPNEPTEPEEDEITEPTLKTVWENTSANLPTNGRYATAFGGNIYISDYSNKKIVKVSGEGDNNVADYMTNDAFLGSAITSDQAGNIIISNSTTGDATTLNNWAIIPAGSTSEVKTISITTPSTVTAARVDQVGRVIGDVASADGAYMYMTPNASKIAVCAKIANNQVTTVNASSEFKWAFSSSNIAQPMLTTASSISSTENYADYMYTKTRNSESIFYQATKYYTVTADSNLNGFDVFELGGVKYVVYPTSNLSFNVAKLQNNEVVATETDANTCTLQHNTLVAEVVSATKANIYQYNCGKKAAMYTFEVPVGDATAIEEVEVEVEVPVEYYNLQGVRVANPEKGLYIKRQGNKVTKVIL